MTGIETALLVASTAVSAVGAVASGLSQSAAYKRQSQMDQFNAQLAEANAANTMKQAEAERSVANQQEDQQRRRARQIIGAQAAAGAQSGVGPGGSQALALEDSATQAELDALNIRYEGQMRARATEFQSQNYSNQAASFRMQAGQNRANASSAKVGGFINAGAGLLKGASSAYGGRKSGVKVGEG